MPHNLNSCSKCLTSIELLFQNHSVDSALLSEFVRECLDLSRAHIQVADSTITLQQRLHYCRMHSQAELLLSIIRGLHVSRKQLH